MSPPPAPPAAVAVPAWTGPALVVAAAGAMLAWTWRTWPDPLVDYGREVYLAWQIAKGRTLYTELAHFNGPLSPYLNGLVFRLFGPGILTLALANAVVAGLCLAAAYALLARVAGRLAATLGALVFVTVFFCARFVRLGNYNWLAPYSHELPHGVALGVAALWCLSRYHRTRAPGWLAATGGAVGLAALTKAEVLLATGVGVAAGVALTLWRERPTARRLRRLGAAFGAGLVVPLAVAAGHFALHMPLGEVLRWPLGYWHAASRPELVGLPMYREGLGLDDAWGNARRLAAALGWTALAFAPGVAGAFALRGGRGGVAARGALALACGAAAWWLVPSARWFEVARAYPVLLALVVAGLLAAWWRAEGAERADRLALAAALALFALALLAKMALNTRVFHYGFALAMPATLVLVAAAVAWAPALVAHAGGDGAVLRAVASALLVAMVAGQLAVARPVLARQTAVLGSGPDALLGDDRVGPVRALLDEVERRVGVYQSLAVVPEGILVNYLARRASSVRYVQYSPVSLLLWGEDRLVADFARTPPDFVAIVHRDNAHEGARFFGRDYAAALQAWIDARYRTVWRFGAPPNRDGRFGIELRARVDPPVSVPPATGGR